MVESQQIGETAGQVWNFLRENGKSSVSAVEKGVRAPKLLVHMAVGWLAREGKLDFVEEKGSLKLWLTEG